MQITELVAELVLQVGVILLTVRIFGQIAKKIGIPPVLGELIAGVIIGPFALGGIPLPFFPHGIFPLALDNGLAVSVELYAFATVASIVLLFVSGLETNLGLFLRYSFAGGIIGVSGALLSFAAGCLCGVFVFNASFLDPHCLFLGVIAMTTSVGISARTLSEKNKIESPEGVTILAASVFDDVVWIILLAVVLGIVSITAGNTGTSLTAASILLMAGKIFGIWLGTMVIMLLCSKILAKFLKYFKNSYEYSVLSLGLALILAGLLEKQGLALIIGAYIAGLSFSKTDIAPIIKERIKPLYQFFVPMFFAVMGMMVNIREIISPNILIFSGILTLAVILAKIFGCGGPALLLGFNRIGAIRIGSGMIPRGEGALITCGIGLAAGILDNQLFSSSVFMIFLTIVAAPPLLGLTFKIPGQGTRRPVKNDDNVQEIWKFHTGEIADLVMNKLLKELRTSDFYVQTIVINDGISSQARKGDISIILTEVESNVTVSTSKTDMPFVKNEILEVILALSHIIEELKASADTKEMKKELLDTDARTTKDILALIDPECFTMELKGETKEELIIELIDILALKGKLLNRDEALADVLRREKDMSTGMAHGIALPHAKTNGVNETTVAIGIKKAGVNFESIDGQPSRVFLLVVSPKKNGGGLHVQFLAAVGSILKEESMREAVINAASPQEAVDLLRKQK